MTAQEMEARITETVNSIFEDFLISQKEHAFVTSFLRFHLTESDIKKGVPYNLLIISDDRSRRETFGLKVLEALRKLSKERCSIAVLTGKELLSNEYDIKVLAKKYRALYVPDFTYAENPDWSFIEQDLESTPDLIKIFGTSTDQAASRFSGNEHLFYRILAYHIRLGEIQPDDIVKAFLNLLERKGLHYTSLFEEDITAYIQTVYPKADLKEQAFIDDLYNRVITKLFGRSSSSQEIDRDCVPFYRKPEILPEIAAPDPDMNISERITEILQPGLPDTVIYNSDRPLNVLLLSLSTINPNTIGTFSNYRFMEEDGTTITVTGNYQLDPVPNMLKEKGIQLDDVIMLETSKVMTEKKAVIVENEDFVDEITAADYFKLHLKDKLSAHGHIQEIYLDENNPEEAIYHAFTYLSELSKSGKINLIIDTHGGFRGIQLLCSVISSLLDEDRFRLTTYTVQYDAYSSMNEIVLDRTARIFDFSSGIHEFITHGTVKNLLRFLDQEKNRDLINPIIEISDGITWCDIDKLTIGLAHLRNYYSKSKSVDDKYLKLFEARIREDYGPLLGSSTPDVIDISKWCMKKGFYQQALTILESKTASSLFDHQIITLTQNGMDLISKQRIDSLLITEHNMLDGAVFLFDIRLSIWDNDKGEKGNRDLFNSTFKSYILERTDKGTGSTSLSLTISRIKKTVLAEYDVTSLLESAQNSSPKGLSGDSQLYKDVLDFSLSERSENYLDRLAVLLLMYKTIKDIRNRVNHVDDNPYHQNAITNALYFYIDLMMNLSNND